MARPPSLVCLMIWLHALGPAAAYYVPGVYPQEYATGSVVQSEAPTRRRGARAGRGARRPFCGAPARARARVWRAMAAGARALGLSRPRPPAHAAPARHACAVHVNSLTSFETEMPFDYYSMVRARAFAGWAAPARGSASQRRPGEPPPLPGSPHAPHAPLSEPRRAQPFCKPPEGVRQIQDTANIGTVLQGLRIENSPYNLTIMVRVGLRTPQAPRQRSSAAPPPRLAG